jgi:threonine/homoserine/homoserine lactone efflux protein
MDAAISILSIAGAVTLGAMSPGPSFVMVARTAVANSRADGLAAALGMGVGGVLFACAALLGLHVILTAVPWLYLGLKLVGGAYLIYLGCMIWRGARRLLQIGECVPSTSRRSFLLGLLTQISNPKAAVVYASIFIALLPQEVPLAAMLILPPAIFVIEAGWYSVVALALSAPSPRAAYLRWKVWVDRAAGSAMALLGIKLIATART